MEIEGKQVITQSREDVEKGQRDIESNNSKNDQVQIKQAIESVGTVWDEAFLITFSPDDPENPLNWSQKLKWAVTAAVSGTDFIRITVSTVSLHPAQANTSCLQDWLLMKCVCR